MSLFNPQTLDASIRDVAVNLNDAQKADVLLHALQHLSIQEYRTVVENAVRSILQIPDLPPTCAERALMLRAKCRLAAGNRASAQQDLLSVLTVGLDNQDVKAIRQLQHARPQMLLGEPDRPPRFSEELWREIALFLPRRDLKSLLFVPHALSRIASQLLFREIDLHFTESEDTSSSQGSVEEECDLRRYQRSADILARILVDAHFAGHIRSLDIFAISYDDTQNLAFQVGMLMNALPKLLNLCKIHCSGKTELVTRILHTVHSHHPCLQGLSLEVVDFDVDFQLPVFKRLTQFSIDADDDISGCSSMDRFLAQTRDTLRSLSIKTHFWPYPVELISVQRLTQFEFHGCLAPDMQAFSEILAHGHQIESLMLSGTLGCTPSALFRQHCTALPLLRHFALDITSLRQHITDRDLCPAISDFLRERAQLRTYQLLVSSADARRIGFNASAWGVLPALSELTSLTMSYPNDLSLSLAGWLVPRTVHALSLDMAHMATKDPIMMMNKLRMALPPQLRYIKITGMENYPVSSIVEPGFPNLRVVQIDGKFWTVIRSREDGSVSVEEWPHQWTGNYVVERLESLECTDAIWWSPGGQLF